MVKTKQIQPRTNPRLRAHKLLVRDKAARSLKRVELPEFLEIIRRKYLLLEMISSLNMWTDS